MADIYEIAERFRNALLRREIEAASRIVRAYGEAWRVLRPELDALTARIAERRAASEEVSAAWLVREDRYRSLLAQLAAQVRELVGFVDQQTREQQREVIAAADDHAAQLVRAGMGPPPAGVRATFARLPTVAVETMVGALADGSPLRDLLDELGPDAARRVETALISGIATGRGPREVARLTRDAFAGNLTRALRIARTETLRAYREASRRSYEENADVVSGWIWLSARQPGRTCGFCWSMDGSEHPTSERMATHVQCRCTMVPKTRSWTELGFAGVPETQPPPEQGEALFAALSPEDKLKTLGPAKYRAYRAGTLTLADLRGFRTDPRWGRVGFERSLADAIGLKQAESYERAATYGVDINPDYPVNERIRSLVKTGRPLTREDASAIGTRLSTAPFNDERVNVFPQTLIGQVFEGAPLKREEPSLRAHLAKRVLDDQEWSSSTTLDEYLADLHAVAHHPDVRIGVLVREKRQMAVAYAPNTTPPGRRGPGARSLTAVFYDAGRGRILSGYQIDDAELGRVFPGAQWYEPS